MAFNNLYMYASPDQQHFSWRSLIAFGLKTLHRAIIVKRHAFFLEFLKRLNSNLELNRIITYDYVFEYLVDCIKIIIFFENYMKAELIRKDYCVHSIRHNYKGFNSLSKAQKKRPVLLSEINNIKGFDIDETRKIITHPAIMPTTISFNTLLKPEYINHYEIRTSLMQTIRDISKYRNSLHYFDNIKFSLSFGYLKQVYEIIEFSKVQSLKVNKTSP